MNPDNVLLLMALFWQGFSLSFVTVIWFQRLAPQFSHRHDGGLPRVSLGLRVVISLLGLSGAFGTAALSSQFRGQVAGTDAILVAGLIVGIGIAFALRARSKSQPTPP
jgi:hypothetical protein